MISNSATLAITLLACLAFSSATGSNYRYEVEVGFRPVYSPNSFGTPSIVLTTNDGSQFNVSLTKGDKWMNQGHKNVSVIDVPLRIEEIRNVSFGWTTPRKVDEFDTQHVSIYLQLKPIYDQSLKGRKFYGHLIRPNQPVVLYEDNQIRNARSRPYLMSETGSRYKYEVVVESRPAYSSPVFGKASLLLNTTNGQINVTLSKVDESMDMGTTKIYLIETTVKTEDIKHVSFTWTRPGGESPGEEVLNIGLTLKPVYDERLPWRRFSGGVIRAFQPQLLWELESVNKFVVEIHFQPVYSRNSFGKPSLLLSTKIGYEHNVTLTEKDVWMNATKTSVYEFYAPTKIEDITNLTFGWTNAQPHDYFGTQHVNVHVKVRLAYNNQAKAREFFGDFIRPDEPETLWENKDIVNYVSVPPTKLRVNVTFQAVYSPSSFGKMSLLFVTENAANSVNVSLSKEDENLNIGATNVYDVQVPLFLEEVKYVNFTWTTPVARREYDTRHLLAHFEIETIPISGNLRKFYSSLAFPNEVYKLWEDTDKIE